MFWENSSLVPAPCLSHGISSPGTFLCILQGSSPPSEEGSLLLPSLEDFRDLPAPWALLHPLYSPLTAATIRFYVPYPTLPHPSPNPS